MYIFLFLSKAFDSVNHRILLNYLEYLRIRGQILKLFENYLVGRMQIVNIGTVTSENLTNTYDVQQVTILSTVAF